MKDLKRLVGECKADLDSLGIKYGKVRNWSVNTRAKRRLGQCKKVGTDLFDIDISAALLDDAAQEQSAKNTIVHELLHTVPYCFDHTGRWKFLAQYVNSRLPQYTVKRVVSYEECGVRPAAQYRYILRCCKCGQEIRRQRMSKTVKNYKNYRCGKCGGRLERIV